MKWLKYIGYGLLISSFLGYLAWALNLSTQTYNNQVCTKSSITWIKNKPELNLIETADIEKILEKDLRLCKGRKLPKISAYELEKKLETLTEIENTEVYTQQSGELTIQITPSEVIATIFNDKQEQFYLDAQGKVIIAKPGRSAYVPVVYGAIFYPYEKVNNVIQFARLNPSAHHKWFVHLHEFIKHISQSEFWKAEIQQIQVLSGNDIRLYMRSHDCVVKLGSLANYSYKLKKLALFYQKGFNQVGWNKYRTIDLQYSNQLVCEKKEHNGE